MAIAINITADSSPIEAVFKQLINIDGDMSSLYDEIGAKGVELNKHYVKAPYKEVIMDATHWIPVQNAKELSQTILETIA